MGVFSILSGIVSLFQVMTGQATLSATTIYQTAVMVDKVTTEDFRGTWTSELEEQIIQGFVIKVDEKE
jgi:hypothetical protein